MRYDLAFKGNISENGAGLLHFRHAEQFPANCRAFSGDFIFAEVVARRQDLFTQESFLIS